MKAGKLIVFTATFALAAVALISMSSCGGGGGSDTPDVAALLKSGTWKVNAVTVDGTNQLSLFTGLTVTFSASSFSAVNGGVVWPSSGTWTLNTAGTTISRGDGLSISIDNISETALTLSLFWDKTILDGGRSQALEGDHVFTFGK